MKTIILLLILNKQSHKNDFEVSTLVSHYSLGRKISPYTPNHFLLSEPSGSCGQRAYILFNLLSNFHSKATSTIRSPLNQNTVKGQRGVYLEKKGRVLNLNRRSSHLTIHQTDLQITRRLRTKEHDVTVEGLSKTLLH